MTIVGHINRTDIHMIYLLAVTLLWAFSFSLIGVYLTNVDPWFSAWFRATLALIVFIPFLKLRVFSGQFAPKLMLTGAIQLGLMYTFYYHAFLYLSVPEVLLFTIMTPIYVTLFNDLADRQFRRLNFSAALIAVFGALLIRYDHISSQFLIGLVLVQAANMCFAFGQVWYKRLMATDAAPQATPSHPQHHTFGMFYVGAFVLTSITYAVFGNVDRLPTTQTEWTVLIYLGVVASGLGYFAWNKGATEVSVGTLAAMNNALIPAGIFVNVLIWNRDAELLRLTIGGTVILIALILAHRTSMNESNEQKR